MKLRWFTHANIACQENKKLEFDLTEFIGIFILNEIWKKIRYRTEYNYKFEKIDLEKIKSIKFIIHTEIAPFSNLHGYENILNQYIDIQQISPQNLFSSGISSAKKIAVIEVELNKISQQLKNLTYEQEKDVDSIFGQLTAKNLDTWNELKKIKSIICEFIQFFMFNFHLNYLTHQYTFSITDKPEPIGFTVVSENNSYYYETDKIELLSHYILYVKQNDNLQQLMKTTSFFWCTNISSIHFFLDAVKGNYITSTNFTKLVFTLESFFGKNISTDYITLVIPLLISNNITDMKYNRELIRKSFSIRNEIVHGNLVINFLEESNKVNKNGSIKEMGMDEIFFELKNLIIKIFYFYMNNELYLRPDSLKITHELIFRLLPRGIN